MKTEPNQLAHSFAPATCNEGNYNGLTKREHFAAMAMQSMLGIEMDRSESHAIYKIERVALNAVRMADALITALNK